MRFLCTVGILLGAAPAAWGQGIAPQELSRSSEMIAANVQVDQSVQIDPEREPASVVANVFDTPTACCQSRRDRAPTETIDVAPPRLKSMEEHAEVSVPIYSTVAAVATQAIQPASKHRIDIYVGDDNDLVGPAPSPIALPPCCQKKRSQPKTETVDVLPPRLKSMEEVAEVKVPEERQPVIAVSRQNVPSTSAEELEYEVPSYRPQPRPIRTAEVASAESSARGEHPDFGPAAGVLVICGLGALLALRRRRGLRGTGSPRVFSPEWNDRRPPYRRPAKKAVPAAQCTPSEQRQLEAV